MSDESLLRKSPSRRTDDPVEPGQSATAQWGYCLREGFASRARRPRVKPPNPDQKWCSRCASWKDRDEDFHLDRSRKGGLAVYCRTCANVKTNGIRWRARKATIPCTTIAVGTEFKGYVLCSAPVARRPHDEVHGFKRGYEPSSHPIWASRVKRMLSALVDGPLTAAEIQTVLKKTKLWTPAYTVNVLIAAQELEMVAYDGVRWHARRPGSPPPPMVEKPKAPSLDPLDDLYPDQLPL